MTNMEERMVIQMTGEPDDPFLKGWNVSSRYYSQQLLESLKRGPWVHTNYERRSRIEQQRS